MTSEELENKHLPGTDPLVYLPSVSELTERVNSVKLELRRLEILLKAAQELEATKPRPVSSYAGEKS